MLAFNISQSYPQKLYLSIVDETNEDPDSIFDDESKYELLIDESLLFLILFAIIRVNLFNMAYTF